MTKRVFMSAAAVAAAITSAASAAPLYTQNFDVDDTANWTVNSGPGTNPVNVFFDYSTVGIPSAPNSTGGTTRGLKMQANVGSAVFGGVSVSPTGQTFTGDYTVRFDLWQNYHGPLNGGGTGSTQVTGAGILTAGTTPQWAGGVQDSLHFGTTGDGGSTVDYRAYSSAAGTGYGDASGVFAAGNTAGVRNNTHTYYSGFGGETAPAPQVALFPGQTGATAAGSQGFAWRDVIISKIGDTVTYTIDGTLIATVDISALTVGGSNILFNQYDINATSATDPSNLLFGLVDNVRVEVIPEPTSLALLGVGGLFLGRRRRA